MCTIQFTHCTLSTQNGEKIEQYNNRRIQNSIYRVFPIKPVGYIKSYAAPKSMKQLIWSKKYPIAQFIKPYGIQCTCKMDFGNGLYLCITDFFFFTSQIFMNKKSIDGTID